MSQEQPDERPASEVPEQLQPGEMDKKTKKRFPTLFVHEGAILMYEKGMLVFHAKITTAEWMLIVEETIKYHTFLVALKDVGMPRLHEPWTKLHEYFLRGLEVNLGRMRNIDPLLFARVDREQLLTAYKFKMEVNSEEVLKEIDAVREQVEAQRGASGIDLNIVSDL